MRNSCWVLSGMLPCGARRIDDMPADLGRRAWLDVCILGQHLPQMYNEKEITGLFPETCGRLGLCADCLGFGTVATDGVPPGLSALGIDEIPELCETCGGSGRGAIRMTVTRSASGVTGQITVLPHGYVEPLASTIQTCLACGVERDGKGPDGQPAHLLSA